MRRGVRWWAPAVLTLVAGCWQLLPGSDRRDGGADAGDAVFDAEVADVAQDVVDATVEAAVDATDATVDDAVDVPADDTVDAAVDVGADAAFDVAIDTHMDAGVDVHADAAVDAAEDAPRDIADIDGGMDVPADSDAEAPDAGADVTSELPLIDVTDIGGTGDLGDVVESCDARCQPWEICAAGRCVNSTAVQFAAGTAHSCLLRASGHIWCWGENGSGQFGDGSRTSSLAPVRILTIDDAVAVESAGSNMCARLRSGLAYCWGATRGWGGSGGGAPTAFTGITDVVSVSAGAGHTCAVSAAGTARCGGSNVGGELGNGTMTTTTSPVLVQNLTDAVEVSVGGPGNTSAGHTCARRRSGAVSCWGSNQYGQLGTGTMTASAVPVPVPGLADVEEIALGTNHSCARRATGAVVCWGRNLEGQIGDATRDDRNAPTPAFGITDAVDIDANAGFNCAVRATGAVLCWGQNFNQQLGTNVSGRDATIPTVIAGVTDAVHVAVGGEHACAIRRNGSLVCWGKNVAGQVGDRTTTSPRPTPVTINVP